MALQLRDQDVRTVLLDHGECLGGRGGLADDVDCDPPQNLLYGVEPHRVGVADDSRLLSSAAHRKGRLSSCCRDKSVGIDSALCIGLEGFLPGVSYSFFR